jgi:hypothetical protein
MKKLIPRLESPIIDQSGPSSRAVKLPQSKEIKNLSEDEAYDLLKNFYALPDLKRQYDHLAQKCGNLKNMRGSFQAKELQKVIDSVTGDEIHSQLKRASTQFSISEMLEGDVEKIVLWVAEGEDSCENCMAMAGWIGRFVDLEVMPGANICLGGDRCRCQLIEVQ